MISIATGTVKSANNRNINALPNEKNVMKKVPETFLTLGWQISLVYDGMAHPRYCAANPIINRPINRKAWWDPNMYD